LYNLNLFLFIKYAIWLDMIISWEYCRNPRGSISFITRMHLIYKSFRVSIKIVEKDPDFFKNLRIFNNHKK